MELHVCIRQAVYLSNVYDWWYVTMTTWPDTGRHEKFHGRIAGNSYRRWRIEVAFDIDH